MNVKSLRILSLAAAATLAACGDDGTGPEADLSQAEAVALAEIIASSAFMGAGYVPTDGTAAGAPARTPWTVDDELIAESLPCEFGGTVSVEGSLTAEGDDEEGWAEAELSLTQTHDGCGAAAQDGTRFTLSGAPNVTANFSVSVSEESISLDGGYGGALEWETDGRSGKCTIDFDIAIDVNAGAETASVDMGGTVCGISVSRSVTVG